MDETKRPKDNESQPTDGPLTELAKKRAQPPQAAASTDELPQPVPAKHTGAENYARGTAEHDDDRDV